MDQQYPAEKKGETAEASQSPAREKRSQLAPVAT
jgi:hypothetical protein